MAKAEAAVEELVGMIERGELRLPEMQRRYVWRSTRVRALGRQRDRPLHLLSMKRIALALVFIGNAFLLGACIATLPLNYAPSNLTQGTGTVSVERFVYSAARQGKVAPNEVEKNPSGIGAIYLAEDIESFFTDAVRKELRFSGYSLTESDAPTVGGVIDRFYYDWVGFITTDVEVAVTFEVRKDGKAIFSRLISSHKEFPKESGYETEAIKAAISECIQRFLEEAQEQGVL